MGKKRTSSKDKDELIDLADASAVAAEPVARRSPTLAAPVAGRAFAGADAPAVIRRDDTTRPMSRNQRRKRNRAARRAGGATPTAATAAAPAVASPAPTNATAPAAATATATAAPASAPAPAPAVARVSLATHEAAGGHTIERHVGKSDDYLRQRLARQRNIRAASTFADQDVAEKAIGALLEAKKAQIDAWLANGAPNSGSAFRGTYASTVGARLPRGAADPAQVSGLTVVLRRADTMPGGYRILTAYPEA